MKLNITTHAFAVLAIFFVVGSGVRAEQNLEYRTHLNSLEWSVGNYNRNIASKESVRAATELRVEGNKFYLSKNYHWAFRRYDDSRVWLSTPDILFLVGDSALRDRVSQLKKSELYGQQGNGCWTPTAFVFEVTRLLTENHEVGFEIIERLGLASAKATPLYKRAYSSASCLQKLTYHYGRLGEREKLPACVDAKAIETCLGELLPVN